MSRQSLQLLCAVTLMVLGAALLLGAFLTPPSGEIDSSVLVAFGEILTFAGAVFGLDYKYKNK